MATESLTIATDTPGGQGDAIRRLVHEACEPVSQFWPMKRFVHHNPIHGLEHLPFDQAVREARQLVGGAGYLPNDEYRRMYRDGRITDESVAGALKRQGPSFDGPRRVAVGGWQVEAADVWRAHLLFGFAPLEPMLLPWTLGAGGALERLQPDVPDTARRTLLLERRARSGGSDATPAAEAECLGALWTAIAGAVTHLSDTAAQAHEPPVAGTTDLPAGRTVADWVDRLADASLVESLNAQMIKWVSAFVDEGMAGWAMPGREAGLYAAWRRLAALDWSGSLAGIDGWSEKVRRLPDAPDEAIALALERLRVPDDRRTEYLARHLAQLPGWAGLVRWLGENPGYMGQAGHPSDALQYLAIRLSYEVELAGALTRRRWGIEATLPALAAYWREHPDEYARRMGDPAAAHDAEADLLSRRAWPLFRLAQFTGLTPDRARQLTPEAATTLLGWLDAFPEERHGPVWLEAYEDAYRLGLVDALVAHHGSQADRETSVDRPRAQLIFCIDVRSESLRRHVERQGPYETYGYAGFFGVPMNHEAFDGDERFPLCPVLLTPTHAVDETVRPEESRHLQSYASGTSWLGLGHRLLHDLKRHPVSSLAVVDTLGFFFGAGLVGKTLAPGWHQSVKDTLRGWFRPRVGTRVDVGGAADAHHARGFSIEEQAAMVEGGLRTIGLTSRLGRFVVLCGHGSESDNNPYFGALHCGACGGKHGDANARAFASMANNPEVRAVLASHGLTIPEDTWFQAAKHITTSDRIEFYDLEDLPPGHRADLAALKADLAQAGAHQALERCGRLPGAAGGSASRAWGHVNVRTMDWANTRPEWGLASNAAFIIGRRSLTRGLSLRGRAFLHSYNPDHDPDGAILERIMTAPLVVGQWINMEHYFSAVDPWVWGSGSKIIHNVVAGVGVMLGSQSDLQTGLPLQTVNDGPVHYHEPVRLLTVIEAPTARISQAIGKHAILQGLYHNGWLNLIAIDPATFAVHRYNPDGSWEAVRPPSAPEAAAETRK